MPALDVLRGVAILGVVLDHSLYWEGAVGRTHGIGQLFAKASSAGWLGVNLFFVLSGFLITGILMDSRGNDNYFRRFYMRRELRILRAYLLTIAILLGLHRISRTFLAASLLFLTNYAGFFTNHHEGNYGVFWTLSVEEQFYLFWPAIVYQLRRARLVALCGIFLLVAPALRFLAQGGHPWLGDPHGTTVLIADNLVCGALAAIFVRSRLGTVRHGRRIGLLLVGCGVLGELAGIPFGIVHRDTPFGAAFQIVPWDLAFTGLLLWMLSKGDALFSTAWSAPLRLLGYVSYGLYLSHLLIFDFYDYAVRAVTHGPVQGVLVAPYPRLLLAGFLAVGVAWLSRRFFEDRFLRIRTGNRPRKLLRQAP